MNENLTKNVKHYIPLLSKTIHFRTWVLVVYSNSQIHIKLGIVDSLLYKKILDVI